MILFLNPTVVLGLHLFCQLRVLDFLEILFRIAWTLQVARLLVYDLASLGGLSDEDSLIYRIRKNVLIIPLLG